MRHDIRRRPVGKELDCEHRFLHREIRRGKTLTFG
jgi:hypothetical protein